MHTIIAPCDGFISKKNVQVGQLVNPGQTLMSLVDDSQVMDYCQL
jgi:membrane fusion protein (multidrug efflux system)